jgi:hypothetical protein
VPHGHGCFIFGCRVGITFNKLAATFDHKESTMSTPDTPSTPATAAAGMHDPGQDLEAAARAFHASTARRPPAAAPDILTFASQLSFLLTIGYLTKPQADALLSWFKSNGTMKLPLLTGPEGISGPTMYEILSTSIHFGTPQSAAPGDADILDFFSGLANAVGDLITTVTDGVTSVLTAGTGLIEAGTQLVHEIHTVLAA